MEKFWLRQNDGFTLIEVIFALGILSVILALVTPVSWTLLKDQQEKQFIDTLQSDLLLIQSLSGGKEEDQIKITFHEHHYTVQTSRLRKEIHRPLPPGWSHPPRLYNVVSFSNGLVRKPGTIKFKTNHDKEVKLVFPLGRGRGYIAK